MTLWEGGEDAAVPRRFTDALKREERRRGADSGRRRWLTTPMGFLDKAKKMAEQAQAKLDEAQKQFNPSQGGGASSSGPAVEYDEHGRPVPQEPRRRGRRRRRATRSPATPRRTPPRRTSGARPQATRRAAGRAADAAAAPPRTGAGRPRPRPTPAPAAGGAAPTPPATLPAPRPRTATARATRRRSSRAATRSRAERPRASR